MLMRVCAALAVLWMTAVALPAHSQEWPTKPVRFIVPYPPGGSTDNVGRVVAQKLTDMLGQPFVVDNRGGAAAAIGTDMAAKSPPDGYTVVCTTVASLSINPHLTKLPYDPMKDLVPVSMASVGPMFLAVNNDLPAKTVQDVIKLAKAKPGTLNFGSPGNGSISQIHGEVFKIAAGIDIVHVPYRGSGPGMTDLMSGQVQLFFESSVLPFIVAGKMRGVGIAAKTRWPDLPNVPTFAEQGVSDVDDLQSWFGVLAPAGTPQPIVDKLAAAIVKLLDDPDTKARFTSFAMLPSPIAKEQFAARIKADYDYYGKLIARTGIKLD